MMDVQGQERAVVQLQRALAAGRLASTWIFAGPTGVGKFRLAVDLAKTVLCDRPQRVPNEHRVARLTPEFLLTLPCGNCESCHAIAASLGTHPDLHIITKELIRYHDKGGKSKGTTLSIDVIRGEITGDTKEGKEAKIYKRSFRGRGKFFILDEAELMEAPAQNALLKTLEEPPAESYLILITTSPEELLSTIRSRSQMVNFRALSNEIVTQGLVGAGVEGEDAELLARLARGSLGRAMRWVDEMRAISQKNAAAAEKAAPEDADEEGGSNKFTPGGVVGWTKELGNVLDQLVAGRVGASDVAERIAAFAAEYAELALMRDKLASADRAKRDGVGLLMSIAAEWFSDRLRHGLGVPHETPLPGLTGALDYGVVPQLIAAARAAETDIDMNANEKILLAATATRWELLLHTD